MDDFKITIRAARTNLGMTRKEAAPILDIHHLTLQNYERDSTDIPISFSVKLEKVFGIPTDRIYFGKETEHYKTMKDKLMANV